MRLCAMEDCCSFGSIGLLINKIIKTNFPTREHSPVEETPMPDFQAQAQNVSWGELFKFIGLE